MVNTCSTKPFDDVNYIGTLFAPTRKNSSTETSMKTSSTETRKKSSDEVNYDDKTNNYVDNFTNGVNYIQEDRYSHATDNDNKKSKDDRDSRMFLLHLFHLMTSIS